MKEAEKQKAERKRGNEETRSSGCCCHGNPIKRWPTYEQGIRLQSSVNKHAGSLPFPYPQNQNQLVSEPSQNRTPQISISEMMLVEQVGGLIPLAETLRPATVGSMPEWK